MVFPALTIYDPIPNDPVGNSAETTQLAPPGQSITRQSTAHIHSIDNPYINTVWHNRTPEHRSEN